MKTAFISFALTLIATGHIYAQFTQDSLPYKFDALEPHIDARTMEIHYSKHHAGYIKNLNKAVKGTDLEEKKIDYILNNVSKYSSTIRNNAGGHYNHTFFWEILTPDKNTKPSEKFLKDINKTFGNMENFKSKFIKKASSQFGSGWGWLIVTPENKLVIMSTPNQDNPLMDNAQIKGTPVLGIDVWEHAYYLKYQNKRVDYLNAVWNVINWNEVSSRYEKAVSKK